MCDDEECGVCKFLADAALDQCVGDHVDGGRRFVEDEKAGPREDGAGEAEELFLSLREVGAGGGDRGGQIEEDVRVSFHVCKCRRRGAASARRGFGFGFWGGAVVG